MKKEANNRIPYLTDKQIEKLKNNESKAAVKCSINKDYEDKKPSIMQALLSMISANNDLSRSKQTQGLGK